MKIDMTIEPKVREALTAVVRKQPERLEQAFQDITALPEEDRLHAVRVATGVLWIVLYRMGNAKPSAQEIEEAAADIVRVDDWVKLSQADVSKLLSSVINGVELSRVLTAEKAATLVFIACGSLIAMCTPKGQKWYDYLDECEAALEAAADQQ